MPELSLTIEPAGIRCSSDGALSGPVWISAGAAAFPGKGWTDLVDLVIGDWLDAVAKLAFDNSRKERFYFLDGPYAVDLSLLDGGAVQADLVKRRASDDLVAGTYETDLNHLLSNACAVADQLLQESERHGWANPVLEDLSSFNREIKRKWCL
jgi:hypothetical protein